MSEDGNGRAGGATMPLMSSLLDRRLTRGAAGAAAFAAVRLPLLFKPLYSTISKTRN